MATAVQRREVSVRQGVAWMTRFAVEVAVLEVLALGITMLVMSIRFHYGPWAAR